MAKKLIAATSGEIALAPVAGRLRRRRSYKPNDCSADDKDGSNNPVIAKALGRRVDQSFDYW